MFLNENYCAAASAAAVTNNNERVSSFLTAHRQILGYLVLYHDTAYLHKKGL